MKSSQAVISRTCDLLFHLALEGLSGDKAGSFLQTSLLGLEFTQQYIVPPGFSGFSVCLTSMGQHPEHANPLLQ